VVLVAKLEDLSRVELKLTAERLLALLTPRQAEILSAHLDGLPQDEIGRRMKPPRHVRTIQSEFSAIRAAVDRLFGAA
jgi:DNA-binding NarL/FixJ family response regulator